MIRSAKRKTLEKIWGKYGLFWCEMERRGRGKKEDFIYLSIVLSHVWFFATPWTIAGQAPLSMGFPRQKYWSGLLFPSPGDLPNLGVKPTSPNNGSGLFTTETGKMSLGFPIFELFVSEIVFLSICIQVCIYIFVCCCFRSVLVCIWLFMMLHYVTSFLLLYGIYPFAC